MKTHLAYPYNARTANKWRRRKPELEKKVVAPVRRPTASRCTASVFRWESFVHLTAPAMDATIILSTKGFWKRPNNDQYLATGTIQKGATARKPTVRKNTASVSMQANRVPSCATAAIVATKKVPLEAMLEMGVKDSLRLDQRLRG